MVHVVSLLPAFTDAQGVSFKCLKCADNQCNTRECPYLTYVTTSNSPYRSFSLDNNQLRAHMQHQRQRISTRSAPHAPDRPEPEPEPQAQTRAQTLRSHSTSTQMPVLYVTLHRASDLAASDFSFTGGKSDPYVLVEVERQQEKSACIKSNLNPVWSPAERFRFEVEDVNRAVLGVKVFDYDALNQDDLLGSLVVPLSRFANMMDQSFIEVFTLDVPAEFAKQNRSSTIELEISLKSQDDGDVTFVIWENETWSIGSGWSAADSKDRQQWSTQDESKTSAHFNDVAPPIPPHLEGGGWEYCAKKGDSNGWVYATSWAGPWSSTKSRLHFVRRRLWENHCVAVDSKAEQQAF
ncbi:C2 domain-containing protein, partial [Globisporangium splendens]